MEKPAISIIIVYFNNGNKPHFLKDVFWSLERQTFKNFEVILIDNDSPVSVAGRIEEESTVPVKVVRLNYNHGNCGARNIGTEMATADRIIWNDGDVCYSKNFMEIHANSSADILVSLFNACKASSFLHATQSELKPKTILYEEHFPEDWRDGCCQDPDLTRCVNFVPCGVSIKSEIAKAQPFDMDLNYVLGGPGKGWEDIEMGIRLFKKGYKFEGNENCFTIHLIHACAATGEWEKGKNNFTKLLRKHPDIPEIAKNWFNYTNGHYRKQEPA